MSGNDDARWDKICALFDAAVALPTDRREAFLQRECAGDEALRSRVQSLLAADGGGTVGFRRVVGDVAASAESSTSARLLEQRIGNYRLVELLGAGGMGSVYLGRRIDEKFEHEVAIKVLQTGRTNPYFVERFYAERQALARLEHPNIARLLDGGETDEGLQFLVMEYVRGEPIDTYCDERRLAVRDRLRLFQKICLAVDYAHRNLIIHRDVKPSNVLVTDEGVPKLLDFGVAKVLDATGMDRSLTVAGQRMMTPAYASPEQVRGDPVSTASDIYSLGVLLYRLLCGRGPYRVRGDLPLALTKAILEDLPSKPSTVVTRTVRDEDEHRSGEDISRKRQTTVSRLRRRLRGDLDNIALKTLRKEPEQRYASAGALSRDIDNFLSNRPIDARSYSVGYLAGKFARRHRVGVAASLAVCAVLVAAGMQIIDQRNRAEAQAATAQRVSGFLLSMLASSNPYERSAEVTARDLLDRGARQIDADLAAEPLIGARLRVTMARAYSSLGLQNTARTLGQAALANLAQVPGAELDRANTYTTLATIEYEKQNYAAARDLANSALALYEALAPDDPTPIAVTKMTLSKALVQLDATDEMLSTAQEALDILRQRHGDDHAQTNAAAANLSAIYNVLGDYARAQALAEQVVNWTGDTYGNADLLLGEPLHNLGRITWNRGDFRGANRIYERELEILDKALGPNHPALHDVLVSLGSNQRKLGYAATAKAYYERAIGVLENSESPALGKLANAYGALGTLIMDEGFLDEAEPLIRRALALNLEVYGEGNAANTYRLMHLGIVYRRRGEFDEARNYIQQSVDTARRRYPESHRDVQIMRLQLGVTEGQAGRYAEGRRLLEGVLASLESHQGPSHPLVGQALLELSEIHLDEEQFELADRRLVRSLEVYRSNRDKWHPDIELALRLRAQANQGLGELGEAARLTAEADALNAGRQKVSQSEAKESQRAEF